MRRVHVSLLLAVALTCLTITAVPTSAQTRATHTPRDNAALTMVAWMKAINASIKSGDFTSLQPLYTPTAVLIAGTPTGSKQVQGPAAIAGFWHTWSKNNPGLYWTVVSRKEISPGVYMVLEAVARPGVAVDGRCAHVYVLNAAGLITREYTFAYWSRE